MHLVCMVQKKVLKSFSWFVMACFLSKCLWGLNTVRLKVRTLAFQSSNFSSLVLSFGSQTQQLPLIPPSAAVELQPEGEPQEAKFVYQPDPSRHIHLYKFWQPLLIYCHLQPMKSILSPLSKLYKKRPTEVWEMG